MTRRRLGIVLGGRAGQEQPDCARDAQVTLEQFVVRKPRLRGGCGLRLSASVFCRAPLSGLLSFFDQGLGGVHRPWLTVLTGYEYRTLAY